MLLAVHMKNNSQLFTLVKASRQQDVKAGGLSSLWDRPTNRIKLTNTNACTSKTTSSSQRINSLVFCGNARPIMSRCTDSHTLEFFLPFKCATEMNQTSSKAHYTVADSCKDRTVWTQWCRSMKRYMEALPNTSAANQPFQSNWPSDKVC